MVEVSIEFQKSWDAVLALGTFGAASLASIDLRLILFLVSLALTHRSLILFQLVVNHWLQHMYFLLIKILLNLALQKLLVQLLKILLVLAISSFDCDILVGHRHLIHVVSLSLLCMVDYTWVNHLILLLLRNLLSSAPALLMRCSRVLSLDKRVAILNLQLLEYVHIVELVSMSAL